MGQAFHPDYVPQLSLGGGFSPEGQTKGLEVTELSQGHVATELESSEGRDQSERLKKIPEHKTFSSSATPKPTAPVDPQGPKVTGFTRRSGDLGAIQ